MRKTEISMKQSFIGGLDQFDTLEILNIIFNTENNDITISNGKKTVHLDLSKVIYIGNVTEKQIKAKSKYGNKSNIWKDPFLGYTSLWASSKAVHYIVIDYKTDDGVKEILFKNITKTSVPTFIKAVNEKIKENRPVENEVFL